MFEVERLCVHLGAAPPLQGTLGHIGFQGEFHGSMLPLPEVLLRPAFVERASTQIIVLIIHSVITFHPEGTPLEPVNYLTDRKCIALGFCILSS